MQGINARDHQSLLAIFQKFEQMALIAKSKISIEDDNKAREEMQELKNMYYKFKILFSELDQCTKDYDVKRRSVQRILNKNIRKMQPEIVKKNVYI